MNFALASNSYRNVISDGHDDVCENGDIVYEVIATVPPTSYRNVSHELLVEVYQSWTLGCYVSDLQR